MRDAVSLSDSLAGPDALRRNQATPCATEPKWAQTSQAKFEKLNDQAYELCLQISRPQEKNQATSMQKFDSISCLTVSKLTRRTREVYFLVFRLKCVSGIVQRYLNGDVRSPRGPEHHRGPVVPGTSGSEKRAHSSARRSRDNDL